MQTSPNTILCLVRRLPLPSVDRLRAVSIDDWAVRKRRIYGTLLVEFDRRCPINRLPDRTGATVTDWLGRRPSIQIVARDPSTEYARAAAAGASAALRVADRWHHILNMRQALERWLGRVHGRLRQLLTLDLHRTFAEVVAWEDGRLRHAGRVDMTRGGLESFARTLRADDEVVIEVTGNAMVVSHLLRQHAARVVIANPLQVKAIAHAHVKTDKIAAGVLANLYAAGFLP